MVISGDRDERFRAYAESRLRFEHPALGVVEVRPDRQGHVAGRFPLPSEVTVHVVTSHNPGRQLTDQENDERHERLTAWVDERPELSAWPAAGGNSDWSHTETSIAIAGLSDDQACALGREFGQEAVFAWRESELVVLSCTDGVRVASGWAVV